jgi:sugar lactone lactonase YvrE
MKEYRADTLIEGLYFGEGPRWRGDHLYFSDFYAKAVFKAKEDGTKEKVVDVPNQPSGLGWLPSGEMLVVSMRDLKVLKVVESGTTEHADLSSVATFLANDMVVDERGYAYVGNFGFDLDAFIETHGVAKLLEPPGPPRANLALVTPEGKVSCAWPQMRFPNGMVILADGSLVVAETLGLCLTRFDRAADGSLSNPRTFADLSSRLVAPDGICLDEEGCIWVANAVASECLRVREGGEVVARVETPLTAFACTLGGSDLRTLFVMCAPTSNAKTAAAEPKGMVAVARVDVPGVPSP